MECVNMNFTINEKNYHFTQLCARIVLAFHMLSDGQTDACHETLIDTYHWLSELGYNTENFLESEA